MGKLWLSSLLLLLAIGYVATESEKAQHIQQFLTWVESKKVDVSAIRVQWEKPHRGIAATRDIKQGEPFFFVDSTINPDFIISSYLMKEDDPIRQLGDIKEYAQGLEHLSEVELKGSINWPLGVWLFAEVLKGNSQFNPYFNTLPEYFARADISCPAEGDMVMEYVKELHPTLHSYILTTNLVTDTIFKNLGKFFDKYTHIYKPEWNQLGLFKWSVLAVATRSWPDIIVPYADMFNHHFSASLFPVITKSEGGKGLKFGFIADRDYMAGEEIYISYGRRGVNSIWSNYGFIPSDYDPHTDCLMVSPKVFLQSPYTDWLLKGGYFDLKDKFSQLCVGPNHRDMFNLFGLIRLMNLDDTSIKNPKFLENVFLSGPSTFSLEYRVYRLALEYFHYYTEIFYKHQPLIKEIRNNYPESPCLNEIISVYEKEDAVAELAKVLIVRLWNSMLFTGITPYADIVVGQEEEALAIYEEHLTDLEEQGYNSLTTQE